MYEFHGQLGRGPIEATSCRVAADRWRRRDATTSGRGIIEATTSTTPPAFRHPTPQPYRRGIIEVQ